MSLFYIKHFSVDFRSKLILHIVFSSHNKLKVQKILKFRKLNDELIMTLPKCYFVKYYEKALSRHISFCIFNCFLFLSTIIVRKKQQQRIHKEFFFSYFQILFFTLCTLILINESITMFGYSMQSSEISCSSLWSFLHTNFWHFEHFVFNFWSSFSFSALKDSYQQ